MTIIVREMKVKEIMPDLRIWAHSMRADPAAAAALVEQTLALSLEDFDDFIRSRDQRLWLFKLMQDIQCGRRLPLTTAATA